MLTTFMHGPCHNLYPATAYIGLTQLKDVNLVSDDADEGYIIEVDLEYPTPIQDLHSDYPLAHEV